MKTIVFDFFGVICSEVAPFVLPRYMPAEMAVEIKRTIVQDADLGLITQEAMFGKLAEIAGVPAKQLEDEFWSYVRIDGDVVKLVEGLRQDYRVALLTNAVVPFVRQVMAQHDLERLFHTILVSAEEGLAKPDPAFYARLLVRMNACPKNAVMIDDNPANLVGARAAGMNGLLFESADKLAKDLATVLAA